MVTCHEKMVECQGKIIKRPKKTIECPGKMMKCHEKIINHPGKIIEQQKYEISNKIYKCSLIVPARQRKDPADTSPPDFFMFHGTLFTFHFTRFLTALSPTARPRRHTRPLWSNPQMPWL
jgi:hypothetical protein